MLKRLNKKRMIILAVVIFILSTILTVVLLNSKENTKIAKINTKQIESSKAVSVESSNITRVTGEKTIKTKEERILNWNPIDFNIGEVSSKISGEAISIGKADITVNKFQDRDQNEIVKYDDEITYRIVAKNDGNKKGITIIKDDIPLNTELDGKIMVEGESLEKTISEEELKNGYELTINPNEEITIRFTVKVKGGAGYIISNKAKYQNENEDEKETEEVKTKIESSLNVISTLTTKTEVTTPQKAILVLDVSGSMNKKANENSNTTKLESMKSAVNNFLSKFLANNKNEVMIITYSEYANKAMEKFTTNKDIAYNSIAEMEASGGTNIDDGLTLANSCIGLNDKNTSVILMTDGLPCYYMVNDTRYSEGDGSYYTETPAKHAIDAAKLIKNKNSKVYSIGFGLDSIYGDSKNKAKDLMKKIASTEKEYYDSYNEEKLNQAFSDIVNSITTTKDSKPIGYETTDGIITIKNSEKQTIFNKGQKIEIYLNEYKYGESTPDKTYSWDEFLKLSGENVVTYNENDNNMKFDLTKYMEKEKISLNKVITIRFIDE